MNRRLGGDASLNALMRDEDEGGGEWQDRLVDGGLDQECMLVEREEVDNRHMSLRNALEVLNSRERRLVKLVYMSDARVTLGILAVEFGVSTERVRQIEARAFEKVQRAVAAAAKIETPPMAAYTMSSLIHHKEHPGREVQQDRCLH